jgi:hypothetical protein
MKRILLAVAAAALLALPSDARVKVDTAHDPEADFSTLRAWAWPADGPGQVKMALTKDDDPEPIRKRFEPTVMASVEEALAKKGFRKAGAGESPDFLVAYFALISVSTSGQTLGQFLPGTVAWGLPPFDAVATSLKIYEQGSLVLDVMAPDSKPMWRGVARAEVHRDRPDAERSKRIREAVFDLVNKFPPKQKKKS